MAQYTSLPQFNTADPTVVFGGITTGAQAYPTYYTNKSGIFSTTNAYNNFGWAKVKTLSSRNHPVYAISQRPMLYSNGTHTNLMLGFQREDREDAELENRATSERHSGFAYYSQGFGLLETGDKIKVVTNNSGLINEIGDINFCYYNRGDNTFWEYDGTNFNQVTVAGVTTVTKVGYTLEIYPLGTTPPAAGSGGTTTMYAVWNPSNNGGTGGYDLKYGTGLSLTQEVLENDYEVINDDADGKTYIPVRFTNAEGTDSFKYHYHSMALAQTMEVSQGTPMFFFREINSAFINGVDVDLNTVTDYDNLSSLVIEHNGEDNYFGPNQASEPRQKDQYKVKLYFFDATTYAPVNMSFKAVECSTTTEFGSGATLALVSKSKVTNVLVQMVIVRAADDVNLFDPYAGYYLTESKYTTLDTDTAGKIKISQEFAGVGSAQGGTNTAVTQQYSLLQPLTQNPATDYLNIRLSAPHNRSVDKYAYVIAANKIDLEYDVIDHDPYIEHEYKSILQDSPVIDGVAVDRLELTIRQYEHEINKVIVGADSQYIEGKQTLSMALAARECEDLKSYTTDASQIARLDAAKTAFFNKALTSIQQEFNPADANSWGYSNFGLVSSKNILISLSAEHNNHTGSDNIINPQSEIFAAAILEKLAPATFSAAEKDMIYQVIRSILNPEKDAYYPMIRHLDIASGFHYLSGTGIRSSGGGTESWTEGAMGLWAAKAWGEADSNQALVDLAHAMYTMHTYAALELFTLMPDTTDGYHAEHMYPKSATIADKMLLASRIQRSGVLTQEMWWNPFQNGIMRHYHNYGINMLPLTSATLTYGSNSDLVDALIAQQAANNYILNTVVETPGTTVTQGSFDADITDGTNTYTNFVKVVVGAGGITLAIPQESYQIDQKIQFTDGSVWDIVSPNVTGAQIKIRTKFNVDGNQWEWFIRNTAIFAYADDKTAAQNALDLLTPAAQASGTATPVFDSLGGQELVSSYSYHMMRNIAKSPYIVTPLAQTDPTVDIEFKSVCGATSYTIEIRDASNTVVNTQTFTGEYPSSGVNWVAPMPAGLDAGTYTYDITASDASGVMGTSITDTFTLTSPSTGGGAVTNAIGGTSDLVICAYNE